MRSLFGFTIVRDEDLRLTNERTEALERRLEALIAGISPAMALEGLDVWALAQKSLQVAQSETETVGEQRTAAQAEEWAANERLQAKIAEARRAHASDLEAVDQTRRQADELEAHANRLSGFASLFNNAA